MENVSSSSAFLSSLTKGEDLIFGTLYSLFGVVSLFGNSLLLLVAYRKRTILKPAEFFIVNLAISDVGMTVILFPLATPSFFAHRWLFNHAMCTFYAFCGVLFGLCSLTSLTALSAVCCMKVCYPTYGNKFSPTYAGVLLVCVWIYALIFAVAPLADWGSYGPEPYGTACCIKWKASTREAKYYIVALFIFCYIIPCLLILFSYSLILWTVKVSRRAVKQHMSPRSRANSVHSLIVKLSVSVCIGFLAAWTPYAIVAMWSAFGDASQVPVLAFALCAVFAKSSATYNPLVYLLFKPNFQKYLSKDLSLFQALCTVFCCSRPRVIALQSFHTRDGRASMRFSTAFTDHRGSCRNCADTFECFRNYPRCYRLPQKSDATSKTNPLAILADGSTCRPSLKRTVQVMVLVTRKKTGMGTMNVAGDVLPSNIARDLM
ncbi:opsin-5-like [Sceloporus undulatus]|uniref:opsin-5-like n=1 Tax=Sceloporus undulatus TaxID=8520 RepID=UPI001C4AF40E|nr:opsin-5-like [Sceloporus undulatus]XP_042320015.1 opsin-5-like [Sceloporus undulatus]